MQSIGLNAVTSVDTGEFTLHIDHFAKVTETKAGTTVAVPTTTTRQGVSVDALVTTVSNGTPDPNGAVEVQFLDLFPIVRFTTPLTIGQSEFYLTYAGQRTAFLPILATAAQIDTALEGIPAIAALAPNPPIPGLTGGVTVTADAVAQAFTITFNAAGDRTQITGVGGFRELQTIDTALAAAAAGGEVVFTLGGTPSIPLPGSPTVAQLDTALDPLANGLLLGGVTVTQTNPNRFSIRYDEFGDAPQLFGQGGGTAQHEIQRLDLSQYATLANTEFTLTFVDGISATLPVTANATDIKTALNAVSTIKGVRTDNTGAINVTTVSPNVFDIDFNIFGNQPAIIGLLTKSGGTTVRLPYNATAQAIETALDAVSIADTIVTPGTAAGTFQVTYTEFGDQPNVSSVGYIHEKQKIDVYHVGSFQLSFNNQTTGTLPANATAQQVQDALNALPTVMATGKPVTVKSNADSSYNVVFGADNDQLPFSGVQFEDLVVSTGADGSGSVREIQFITAVKKGEFNSLFYRTNARLLGAITDLNELDSNVFKSFTDTNGNGILDLGLDLIHAGSFILGDIPIDGLVMAKRFDQVNTNVTPEAKLTFAGFFDNDNLI